MKPETRILRAVDPEGCGPAKRTVLVGIARRHGAGPEVVDQLIADGRLVKYGDRKGARWGLPRAPGRPRRAARAA